MMMKSSIICTSIMGLALISTVSVAGSAERQGFIIAHSQEEDVSSEGAPALQPMQIPAADPGRSQGFVEEYAQDREVERLRRVIVAKQREIDSLAQQVSDLARAKERLQQQEALRVYGSKRTYEVKKGDSLWRISGKAQVYNNPRLWMKIYNANMDRIQNPDLIYPGQIFEIPE